MAGVRVGRVVYCKETGNPFEVLDIRLAKDFEDGDKDLISVKKHPSYPGYDRLPRWEKQAGAMWPVDWVHVGQTEFDFD